MTPALRPPVGNSTMAAIISASGRAAITMDRRFCGGVVGSGETTRSSQALLLHRGMTGSGVLPDIGDMQLGAAFFFRSSSG